MTAMQNHASCIATGSNDGSTTYHAYTSGIFCALESKACAFSSRDIVFVDNALYD